MYARAFIDRYREKLRTSDDFADEEELQRSVVDLCIEAVFIAADPQTIAGRIAIAKEFSVNCQKFFIKRMLLSDLSDEEIEIIVRRMKEPDHQSRVITEMLRCENALALFAENIREEEEIAVTPVPTLPSGSSRDPSSGP